MNTEIDRLIPHREPMQLIQEIVELEAKASCTRITIDKRCTFFEIGKGVPVWIGLEYMGQTAALIAGYQVQQGLAKASLGFLLGTRRYTANVEYFAPDQVLIVSAKQSAHVGENLATFDCVIHSDGIELANARLSVLRKKVDET